MDNSGDLMQKKLRMASNVTGYKEKLDEENVLRQDNFLTQENFQRFEQGQTGATKEEKKRAAMFRSQLKEAMMWDEANANALGSEEAYKDILEEAKREKAKLTDDANRTGASKVFHDITGSKRKRAKDKLKRMETVHVNHMVEAIRPAVDKLKTDSDNEVRKTIEDARGYLCEHEPARAAENLTFFDAMTICLKYEKTEITADMKQEDKEAAEAANDEVKEKYENIKTRYNSLTGVEDKGAYGLHEVMYNNSSRYATVNRNIAKFRKKYPNEVDKKGLGGVASSDIARDVARWVKGVDVEDTKEVSLEEMKEAYDHAVNVHTMTNLCNGNPPGEPSKEVYMTSVAYCKDKLKQYRDDAKKFYKDNPGLLTPYPKYEDMVKNSAYIIEMYKTGQSLVSLGKDLYHSMYQYYDKRIKLSNDEKEKSDFTKAMKEAKELAVEVYAYNRRTFVVSTTGNRWDQASKGKAFVPKLEDVKYDQDTGEGVQECKSFEEFVAEQSKYLEQTKEQPVKKP